MSKKMVIRIGICVVVIFAFLLFVGVATSGKKSNMGPCTEYKCDVKHFRLSTTIEIHKGDEYFAKVKGDILRFVTDPLTMYDAKGEKVAYAGDSYHFIAQDSHSIYVNDAVMVEMVGLIDLLGESYDIYNAAGEKVANVTFNAFNTNGKMYDVHGNLIADFNSNIFFYDFDVRIFENCTLDENAVLMIFCSYYSDYRADSSS